MCLKRIHFSPAQISANLTKLESDFIAKGGKWQEFRIGDLFSVKSNPQLNKDSFTFRENGQYPYFTRTVLNNGIAGYVDYLDEKHKIKGGGLAVGMLGMQFFYMEKDFYAGQFTKTCYPKFENFNKQIAYFFIAWLNKNQKVFQGVLVRDFEKVFNDTKIKLPINKNGQIAFDFMESFIKELELERVAEMEAERIKELEAYLQATGLNNYELTDKEKQALDIFANSNSMQSLEWIEFKLVDLFEKISPKFLGKGNKFKAVSKIQTNEYNIPIVYAKFGDNGIMYWAKSGDFETHKNILSIIYNGAVAAGLVYAQPYETGILAEAYFIKLKNQNVSFKVNLFLQCVLLKILYPKYSRDYLATWSNKVENEKIPLPINKNRQIDFDFMESFISAMQKEVIKSVNLWSKKRINATKEVIQKHA